MERVEYLSGLLSYNLSRIAQGVTNKRAEDEQRY